MPPSARRRRRARRSLGRRLAHVRLRSRAVGCALGRRSRVGRRGGRSAFGARGGPCLCAEGARASRTLWGGRGRRGSCCLFVLGEERVRLVGVMDILGMYARSMPAEKTFSLAEDRTTTRTVGSSAIQSNAAPYSRQNLAHVKVDK